MGEASSSDTFKKMEQATRVLCARIVAGTQHVEDGTSRRERSTYDVHENGVHNGKRRSENGIHVPGDATPRETHRANELTRAR